MVEKKKGMMFVLSSPSGAGKTTLTKKLAGSNRNFSISISHTTRKPRPDEVNKKDYYFVDEKEFKSLIKKNSFFEHARIFDNYYGTLKDPVLNFLEQGQDVLFDIDWQGTQQLKKIKNFFLADSTQPNLATFFILPPNIKILKNRLFDRHKGHEKLVEERMKKFNQELSHWNEYDYVIVNDNLEKCYENILKIINCVKNGQVNEATKFAINHNSNEMKKKIEELSK